MATLSFWQKIQSVLYPVSVRKDSTTFNSELELFYFRSRYILATRDAVYSDGPKYRPLVRAFEVPALKARLNSLGSVLVLGTGLASAVHILEAKGIRPKFTLVEIDSLILEWAKEFLPPAAAESVQAINADAFAFIASDEGSYDLIIVDIFFGRDVPEPVTQTPFIEQCKARLSPKGFLVLNYMEQAGEQNGKAKAALEAAFTNVTELSFGINRVYVAAN